MLSRDTPQAVLDVLQKLDEADRDIVQSYIDELEAQVKESGEDDMKDEKPAAAGEQEAAGDEDNASSEAPFPPVYESGEDFDKASNAKQDAADYKSQEEWEKALEKYTEAVLAAPPSALLYANRALSLLKLGRPRAAERDCDLALKENPDSAKALRVRGKARKELGKWEGALADLSQSQAIDFDEETVEDLKFLSDKRVEMEKQDAEKRNKEKERLRKRAEEIKKAQEEAKKEESNREARSPAGGMPGGFPGQMPGGFPGSMPGGMPGMAGIAEMMNDPEIVEGLKNPKVQAAFQDLMSGPGGPMGLMSNPAKLQELMGDPEVGPVLQKLMSKMMGGGIPNMGGNMGRAAGGGEDDIPDISNDLDLDDLPDLEPSH